MTNFCAILGLVLLVSVSEADIDLNPSEPEYGDCGNVTIGGGVSIASPAVIESILWDWGDGTSGSGGFAATHIYSANGTYTVEVTAKANTGETTTVTRTVTISNVTDSCVAEIIQLSLSDPVNGDCGNVTIGGGVSIASPAVIESILWDWGDGTSNFSFFAATHIYSANGTYTVEVTAKANTGETTTVTRTVTISNVTDSCVAEIIQLSLSDPVYGICGDVTIGGGVSIVSPSTAIIERMLWHWGDGSFISGGFAATHTYSANGTYTVDVTARANTGESKTVTQEVIITQVTDSCRDVLRVYPPTVGLRDGRTEETLCVVRRTLLGDPVPTSLEETEFISADPELVEVDENGVLTGTGFGSTEVTVKIRGHPRAVTVPVTLGEVILHPSILLLQTASPSPKQISLKAFNADGSEVDISGMKQEFFGGNSVASVDDQGLVTPLGAPVEFSDSPFIEAELDGRRARNRCFVRVTTDSLELEMQEFEGEHVTFRLPPNVGPYPYSKLMDELQVVEVFDALYRLQLYMTGSTEHGMGRQFFVVDPGIDADGTVPCGRSGNPVRLGVGVDNLRSCFGVEDRIQWGIIGHEFGHNILSHAMFFEFFFHDLTNSPSFVEGLATTVSVYSFEAIIAEPERFGISPETTENFYDVPLIPSKIRTLHYSELTEYEKNPSYADQFNANHLDAIMLKLGDEYGRNFLFRFMSVFYPKGEAYLAFENDTERLTFWVAACSAAARADLRDRFRDKWGFLVDDSYYEDIFPRIQVRASQRDDPRITACQEYENDLRGLLRGALQDPSDLGQGWKWLEWFGAFNDVNFPWIFHSEHSWMFVFEEITPDNLFFYDQSSAGWYFTDPTLYPNLFSFARDAWVFYIVGTTGPREFVDLQSGESFSL